MTREEARHTLIHIYRQCMWAKECEEYGCAVCEDALNMAIEALQREEAEAKGYCHRIKPKGGDAE